VPASLTTTSFALLGLLAWNDDDPDGLTGYELKRRADNTLRFYWVSPAMSQIYTELRRLEDAGAVAASDDHGERRTTRRYRITSTGRVSLRDWLRQPVADFPVLKHPIALRLLMGHLMSADQVAAMLAGYVDALADRRGELRAVRDILGDDQRYRYPAMVADWGMTYYDTEERITRNLLHRVHAETTRKSSR
jgi:DNA-binding PadR family transcriptional regulator